MPSGIPTQAQGLTPAGDIPVTDRGLAYGDGLFETIAVVDGKPKLLAAHLARLQCGADRLAITGLDLEVLRAALLSAAAAFSPHGALKLMVTRGDGPRGYTPPIDQPPRWWLQQFAWTPPAELPARARVAISSVRLGEQPLLAGLKHLNRLEQVLARAENPATRADEALMLDGTGRLVCATSANLFVVREGKLFTPRLDRCGVAGVVRGALLAAAGNGNLPWTILETDLTPESLVGAEEIFLTSALRGVWSVATVDGSPVSGWKVAEACFDYWRALP
jgi:4-amino-4-deoxychorismate lyase